MNINVTAGEKKYVGGTITEATGKDISTAAYQVALGTYDTPGTWAAADSVTGTGSVITVKLLVQSPTAPGTYWVWVRVSDNPEVEDLRVMGPVTVQ